MGIETFKGDRTTICGLLFKGVHANKRYSKLFTKLDELVNTAVDTAEITARLNASLVGFQNPQDRFVVEYLLDLAALEGIEVFRKEYNQFLNW